MDIYGLPWDFMGGQLCSWHSIPLTHSFLAHISSRPYGVEMIAYFLGTLKLPPTYPGLSPLLPTDTPALIPISAPSFLEKAPDSGQVTKYYVYF